MGSTKMFLSKLRVIRSVIYLILRVILSVIYLISFRLQSETILSLPANKKTEIDTKNSFICQFVFPSSRSNSLLHTEILLCIVIWLSII